MTKEFNAQNVRAATKRGFDAMYTIFRADVKREWPHMDKKARMAAARGLVALNHIATYPMQYLSRAATQAAWNERAQKYAAEHQCMEAKYAYYIVPSPVSIICDNVNGAILNSHDRCELYNFAHNVMQYEYRIGDNTDLLAEKYARHIISMQHLLSARANAAKANMFVRPFLEIALQLRNR